MSKPMTDEEWIRRQVDSIRFSFDDIEISAAQEYFHALALDDHEMAWAVLHETGLTPVDLLLIRAQRFGIT